MTPAPMPRRSRAAPAIAPVVRGGTPWPGQVAAPIASPAVGSGPLLVASENDYLTPGALRVAELLARRDRVNAHVVAWVPPVDFHRTLLGDEDARALRDGRLSRRRRQLRRLLHQTVGRAALFSTGVSIGTSVRVFQAAARERGAAYILVGLDDAGAPDRMINERVVLQIARLAEVPVLAVPRGATTLPTRAIAAVDGSAGSVRAAHAAARLLGPDGRLTLAHVVPLRDGRAADGVPERAHDRCCEPELELLADELRARTGARVDTVWLPGEPVSAALALAARLDADLIAGGVSDGGSFPNGSTSAALLRGARRAVLLAPQAADAPSPAHA